MCIFFLPVQRVGMTAPTSCPSTIPSFFLLEPFCLGLCRACGWDQTNRRSDCKPQHQPTDLVGMNTALTLVKLPSWLLLSSHKRTWQMAAQSMSVKQHSLVERQPSTQMAPYSSPVHNLLVGCSEGNNVVNLIVFLSILSLPPPIRQAVLAHCFKSIHKHCSLTVSHINPK